MRNIERTYQFGRPSKWIIFEKLVEHVARLAYANPDELLFFRGQDKDYQSKAGGTTLYPSIYRGDSLPARELRHRFELLEQASKLLVDRFKQAKIDGHRELRVKRYIQWSILQHYEVVPTPLLDVTQSLRVACSFAHPHRQVLALTVARRDVLRIRVAVALQVASIIHASKNRRRR